MSLRPPPRVMHPGDVNQNPEGIGLLDLIREDFATHERTLSPGFVALAAHRLGNWRMGLKSKLARAPVAVAYRVTHQAMITFAGMDLPYNVKIGRRVRFTHHGCVVLGAWSVGDDVIFRGAVTVGLERPESTQIPTIGSRVEIGPRACIVGGVTIGDDTVIAPNTVVTESLPNGTVAIGNPARRATKLEP